MQHTSLAQFLAPMTISELVNWAQSLDPNASWDESVNADPSITRDQLMAWMLESYDDSDTLAWINRVAGV